MFFIFKPPQSIQGAQLLDPDGFKKKTNQEYEELLATQILQARQQDIVLPNKINKSNLIKILQSKLKEAPGSGELIGNARKQRITAFLLMLFMDD